MKTRKILLYAIKIACGLLGLILFRWTPTTGKGVLVYVVAFAVLIALAIGLSSGKDTGYWPEKPEE